MEKRSFAVVLLNEMIYILAVVLLVCNLIGTTKVEDRVIVVLIEMSFLITRLYCKVKSDEDFKKKWKSRKDRKDRS